MSRIQACFNVLKQANKKALIPYVTVGDPNVEVTLSLLTEMVAKGADIIELGVPFSDPMADGPVIQKACERALRQGVSLEQVLALVARFRQSDASTPIVLMGYLNPIECLGYERFVEQAVAAGVDGVLVVDMPPEEGRQLGELAKASELDMIYLLAPTTSRARMQLICEQASGYVYYVSLKGVTGARTPDATVVAERVSLIKEITDIPVAVGFGVKDGASAVMLSQQADGVVVGSALVSLIEKYVEAQPEPSYQALSEELGALLAGIRLALDTN